MSNVVNPYSGLYVDQLKSGHWAIFYPDGDLFGSTTYATKAAATKAMNEYKKHKEKK